MEDFIMKFAEAIEVENVASLKPETNFRDLNEWGSFATLSLISLLEDEYEIEIENSELRELKTLHDLYNYIIEHK